MDKEPENTTNIESMSIGVIDMAVSDIPDFLFQTFSAAPYNLEAVRIQDIFKRHLTPYLDLLKDNLFAFVELPYVDKVYRDTFYNFYSSKLYLYERDTIRISFFNQPIDLSEFRDAEKSKALNNKYLGFIVIRPTFPKIIGRSALSRHAFKNNSFVCCNAKIRATANFIKLKVLAFPHASQDNQLITCSETTVWSLFEYFGNKYPEYAPTLPSEIHDVLQKYSYKRQIPSDGLTVDQLTFVVRELGFGALNYSREKRPDDFDSIISIYVESGIPVIGVVQNDHIAHAINIIGREKDDPQALVQNTNYDQISPGVQILDYNKIDRKYIFIDDNYPPYRSAQLGSPCSYYSDSGWHDCRLTHIIVPLYHKIYLDPVKAKNNFLATLKNKDIGISDDIPRLFKVFLASSRSYKEYIALNKSLDSSIKESILSIPMPKFIWVSELTTLDKFSPNTVTGFFIQDATDPIDYSEESSLNDMPILCGLNNGKYFRYLRNSREKFEFIDTFAAPFEAFCENLN